MRLDTMLSQLQFGSRKAIKKAIKDGNVKVNALTIVDPTFHVDLNKDEVYYLDEKVFYRFPCVVIMNKPKGYECTHESAFYNTVYELLPEEYQRLKLDTIGRLDVDTEGVLLLTNDGALLHQLAHPKKHVDKTYVALLDREFVDLQQLLDGVVLIEHESPFLAKAKDILVQQNEVTLTIDSGKYHQVKRMFAAIGYKVLQLKRIKFASWNVNDLEVGEWKDISHLC
jgi:16S rRNA pseudouridine516 synthase